MLMISKPWFTGLPCQHCKGLFKLGKKREWTLAYIWVSYLIWGQSDTALYIEERDHKNKVPVFTNVSGKAGLQGTLLMDSIQKIGLWQLWRASQPHLISWASLIGT